MFTKNTVLVLGAGASCHYGYPSGEELIDRIVHTIKTKTFPHAASSKREQFFYGQNNKLIDMPSYKELCEKLEFYDPLSIDDFLSQFSFKGDVVEAGKTMIAYEILEAEDKRLLQRFEPEDITRKKMPGIVITQAFKNENWYRFLLHTLTSKATPDELGDNELKLKIITFNYDISLEYAFYSRFMNSHYFGQRAAPFLKKISDNIVHIYGQVGKFQWKGSDGDRANDDYGSYRDITAFKKAKDRKDSIYVIGQDRGKAEDNANKAKTWLSEAESIFFLGFGFNDDNIKLLDLEKSATGAREIYCTNYDGSNEGSKIISLKIDRLFTRPSVNRRIPQVSTKKVFQALVGDFLLT